ncbi:unnamed protein product [Nesidiocoris tenuis]|uniref:Uncharacterized protein n=1 Tax=Nesidiocoris tenuis TaxID=355587 RepID=A0A6H5FZG6_9HEMI|nr:unnamed protein product [Nesidiocoris tenuis]
MKWFWCSDDCCEWLHSSIHTFLCYTFEQLCPVTEGYSRFDKAWKQVLKQVLDQVLKQVLKQAGQHAIQLNLITYSARGSTLGHRTESWSTRRTCCCPGHSTRKPRSYRLEARTLHLDPGLLPLEGLRTTLDIVKKKNRNGRPSGPPPGNGPSGSRPRS